MTTLFDELLKINERNEPTVDGGARIKRLDGAWLSGTPYLWTMFAGRAFVFRDKAQAEAFKTKFNLTGTVIGGTEP